MARGIVKNIPSEAARADLKGILRDEAREKKAKAGRFRDNGDDLEFVITPDAAADEIIEGLRAESGLEVMRAGSRFSLFAAKHGLAAAKPKREKS